MRPFALGLNSHLPHGVSRSFVTALALTLTLTGGAEARRRYQRVFHYSPPSSAMAVDLHTGKILFSKNVSEPRFPASVTKVMTLYLLFDALRDGKLTTRTMLPVSAHAEAQSPTKLGLDEGDKISVSDAIGAIVTKSANDAAVVVAEALAGTEDDFARRMTQKARGLGMLNTTFKNASGLPNPEQTTTAQDLIVLGKAILTDHPERCKVFGTRTFVYNGAIHRNHNTLLYTYPGMEGMKTGFTTASGFNLLASASRGEKRILAVVLGGSSAGTRNATMRTILDGGWSKALTLTAARRTGVQLAVAKPKPVQTASAEPVKRAARQNIVPVRSSPATARPAAMAAIAVKRSKPDSVSHAILLSAMDWGLVAPRSSLRFVGSDKTTDEPEEKASRTAGRVQRDEAVASAVSDDGSSARSKASVSVHYKTKKGKPRPVVAEAPSSERALISAVIDGPAPGKEEPTKEKLSLQQPGTVQSPTREASKSTTGEAPKTAALQKEAARAPAPVLLAASKPQAAAPQTLAAATVAASAALDQPGPYHIQAGAFPDRQKAEERLHSLRQALSSAGMQNQPVFVMQIALPNGSTMYRARAGGFANELKAKVACAQVKRASMECWEIKAQ